MAPTVTTQNFANATPVQAEFPCDVGLSLPLGRKRYNLSNLVRSENRVAILLSAIREVTAVAVQVRNVRRVGVPSQVINPVVLAIAVAVTALFPVRPRPDEREENQVTDLNGTGAEAKVETTVSHGRLLPFSDAVDVRPH